MRFLALLGGLSLVSGAWASFDLMLFLDGTTDRIHRFDPVNNVNLGSFLTVGSTEGLLVDQASATVYTLSQGTMALTLQRYNIATGQMVSEIALPTTFTSPIGFTYQPKLSQGPAGEALLSLYGGIQRMNLATGALIGTPYAWSTNDFTYEISRAGYLSTGEYLVPGESDGTPYSNDRAMVFNSANVWQNSFLVGGPAAASFIWDINARGNRALVTTYNGDSGELFMLTRGASNLTSVRIGSNHPSRYYLFAEWGHGSEGYMISDVLDGVSGPYHYRKFSTVSGSMGQENLISGINRIDATAILLAPEPGGMAALGLGLLVLLRRRR